MFYNFNGIGVFLAILGIIWYILLCSIIVFFIIKIVNKIRHKAESLRFQKIFRFLLKSTITLFCILFFMGGCSTVFMDWQHYKFNELCKTCAGIYIYDRELYNEINGIDYKNTILSNGYRLEWEGLQLNTEYSRITISGLTAFYNDKSGVKHIIYQKRGYKQKSFKIYVVGDEGAGYHIRFWDYHMMIPSGSRFPLNNVFYVDSDNGECK